VEITSVPQTTGGAYAYRIATVAAAAGLLFGFDIAVINGALVFLRAQFALSELQTEIAAGALLLGCAAGASVAGSLSDWLGRRRILIVAASLFAVSSLGAALPHNLVEFIVARLAAGMATGIASMLAPLYIAENSPPAIRGRLVTFNQFAIVTGILIAYLVNWALSGLGPECWRWMFAAAAVPAVIFWIGLLFVPESPRWLVKQGRDFEALEILNRLSGARQAALDLREIQDAVQDEQESLAQLLQPGFRVPLIIAVTLAILQQITGVNTVLYYGSLIFRDQVGHQTTSSALGLNVIIGGINFLATIVAIWIIDKAGRKPLLLASSGGMALSLVALGAAFRVQPVPAYLVLGAILAYVTSFGIGMGPGVWVLMSELFPTRIRGRAMAIATVALWLASLLLTITFLSLVTAIGPSGTFWLYAGLSAFTFVFIWRIVPETRAKTLEQIERMWKAGASAE
jgi:SP family arabinose:H+ symporter-like MFS transporter